MFLVEAKCQAVDSVDEPQKFHSSFEGMLKPNSCFRRARNALVSQSSCSVCPSTSLQFVGGCMSTCANFKGIVLLDGK